MGNLLGEPAFFLALRGLAKPLQQLGVDGSSKSTKSHEKPWAVQFGLGMVE